MKAVPIRGEACHAPAYLADVARGLGLEAAAYDEVAAALAECRSSEVLICGSLYLAGEVLRANGELPD